MNNKDEKVKVGRPKLADEELIKDSWCRVGASLAIALVLAVCGIGVLTTRTPLQVLTFKESSLVQANVSNISNNHNVRIIRASKAENVRVIPARKLTKRIIDANGNVTRIILPNSAK